LHSTSWLLQSATILEGVTEGNYLGSEREDLQCWCFLLP
jgi:hypothetical protein